MGGRFVWITVITNNFELELQQLWNAVCTMYDPMGEIMVHMDHQGNDSYKTFWFLKGLPFASCQS